MQTNITVFPVACGSFGYAVTSDAGHSVRQEHVPGAPGYLLFSMGSDSGQYVSALKLWQGVSRREVRAP